MSSSTRLTRAYKQAKRIYYDDTSKFVFFSDCHRGDNSFADDFAKNRNIYYHALKFYYKEGFHYCELGDGDELWENHSFKTIFEAHKNVYRLLSKFHSEQRLHMVWGNHDMVYQNPDYVKKHLYTYVEPIENKEKALFEGLRYYEALVLEHVETGQEIFCAHGHQADWFNYNLWKWSRLMVRIIWKPLQVWGIADPTSPAKNYKELIRIEKRIKKWIMENNQILTMIGHTHRPKFATPGEIPMFNDGCCVHPWSITSIEIEQGQIALVKWEITTTEDGTLQVVRSYLEEPRLLSEYQKLNA